MKYTKPKEPEHILDPNRRPPEVVISEKLGLDINDLPENAPSSYGSTFHKRLRICGRLHALDQAKLKPFGPKAVALDLGFVWHAALERCWKVMLELQDELVGKGVYDDPKALEVDWAPCEAAAWKLLKCFEDEPGWEEGYKRLETMLSRYFEDNRRSGSRWRIVASEVTLEYIETDEEGDTSPLGPLRYTSRLDVIVVEFTRPQDEDGNEIRTAPYTAATWIVEHKTATRIDPILLDNYALDLQVVGQIWLVLHCLDLSALPPFEGTIVDIITKPRSAGGRVTMKRHEVCPSPYHIRSHEEQVRMIHGELLPMHERTGFLPTFGNCAGPAQWFRRCAYYDVCQVHPTKTIDELVQLYPTQDDADDIDEDDFDLFADPTAAEPDAVLDEIMTLGQD